MADASYRADIDGLRAVAVLSVVAFHANPLMLRGGFVGVDIFFVISGFLISGIIFDGLQDRSFSFMEFYARRVRRLFPALITVLLAVWTIGWFLMLPAQFFALGDYMLAGACFAANILTYAQIDYFDTPAATKPLLHLWSLGVEEQFYIIFPVMIVSSQRAGKLCATLIVFAAISFIANILLTRQYPSFSFYLPVTRFWEFVAGVLLAYRAHRERLLGRPASPLPPSRWREFGAIAGALLIAKSVVSTRSEAFPGWWALLPVLSAVLIIGAGPRTWLNRKVLASPMLRLIGLISYPLYLWHWPLLVIARTYVDHVGESGLHVYATTIGAVALAFVLSWLTYRFVERPVRARRPMPAMRWVAVGSVACAASVALLGFATARNTGFLSRYPTDVQALLAPLVFGADIPAQNVSKNRSGPLVVAYGDSHARHLIAGLRLLQNERTFRVKLIGWQDCALIGAAWGVAPKPGAEETCRTVDAANRKQFETLKPDVVILSAFWPEYSHIEKLGEVVSYFHRIGVPRIVIIGTAPFWPKPPQTLMYEAYAADPQHRVPERLLNFNKTTFPFDEQLKQIASDTGAIYISSYDVFCNDSGCLTRVGDVARDIVQIDLTHYSAAGSRFLIEHVADQIFGPSLSQPVVASGALKSLEPPSSIQPVPYLRPTPLP